MAASKGWLRRHLRWPLDEGDWVALTAPVTLADGQTAAAGKWVRVVRIEDKGERVVVEVSGFSGTPENGQVGSVARMSLARDRVRAGFFPVWWRQHGI